MRILFFLLLLPLYLPAQILLGTEVLTSPNHNKAVRISHYEGGVSLLESPDLQKDELSLRVDNSHYGINNEGLIYQRSQNLSGEVFYVFYGPYRDWEILSIDSGKTKAVTFEHYLDDATLHALVIFSDGTYTNLTSGPDGTVKQTFPSLDQAIQWYNESFKYL